MLVFAFDRYYNASQTIFTLIVSLIYQGPLVATFSFAVCGLDRLAYPPQTPKLIIPGVATVQAEGVSQLCWEYRKQTQALRCYRYRAFSHTFKTP